MRSHVSFARTAAAVAIVLAALATGGGCLHGDVGATTAPKAVFLPTAVVFDGVPPGSTTEQALLVRNEGNGPLQIRSVRLDGPGVFTIENAPEGDFSLAEGEEVEFLFRYSPVEAGDATATARFVLETNDATRPDDMPPGITKNGGTIRVPLRVSEAQARVFVNPNPINFGRVAVGTTSTIDATLSNVGGVQLEDTEVFILGGAGVFQIAAESQLTGPITLAAGESRPIKLTFTPVSNDFIAASLVVMSSDPNAYDGYVVEIFANRGPCLEIRPSASYNFGARLVDASHAKMFTLRSGFDAQRGQPLVVSSLEFAEGSSSAFAVVSAPVTPLTLHSHEDTGFEVSFHPEVLDRVEEALLVATSNDPSFPVTEVRLRGVGVDNVCPVARAACAVRGSDAEALSDMAVRPLDLLDCTAAASSDDDGTIVEYIWSVDEAPRGSTSRPTTADARDTSFLVDLVGNFTVTLTVVDDDGCASEPAVVSIASRPTEAIYLELVWDTPGDPDPTDGGNGTDVDLHLLHPNGCWNDPLWDCHFLARNPNWGDPERRDDDPTLQLEDADGAGPEVITLDNPEAGISYLVGAHYYEEHGFGPSTATIRIYVAGELVFDQIRYMARDDSWWVAAGIQWPSAAITAFNEQFDATPPCTR